MVSPGMCVWYCCKLVCKDAEANALSQKSHVYLDAVHLNLTVGEVTIPSANNCTGKLFLENDFVKISIAIGVEPVEIETTDERTKMDVLQRLAVAITTFQTGANKENTGECGPIYKSSCKNYELVVVAQNVAASWSCHV